MSSARNSPRTLTQSQISRSQSPQNWGDYDSDVYSLDNNASQNSVDMPTGLSESSTIGTRGRGRPRKSQTQSNNSLTRSTPSTTSSQGTPEKRTRKQTTFFSPAMGNNNPSNRRAPRQSRNPRQSRTPSPSENTISTTSSTNSLETEEEDHFHTCAQIPGDTELLDIPTDKVGVLALLPNSIAEIPSNLVPLIKSVYAKLFASALQPPIGEDAEFIAVKKLILAPVVLFTNTKPGMFADECTKKCDLILNDDWSKFTLNSLSDRKEVHRSRQGNDDEQAQHRHKERAVDKYLYMGNLRKGMQRVVSTTKAAPGDANTLQKLQDKHPSSIAAHQEPTKQYTTNAAKIVLDKEDVQSCIRGAVKGAKHGLDKLRVEHLRQIVLGDATCGLLKSFTEFCTRIVNNNFDPRVLPFFRDGEIVAAQKGENDVRPIVICGNIRKIALAAARKALGFTKSKIFLRQYGLTKGGAEKVIVSMQHARELDDTLNIVVLDATNAFNMACRNKAMEMVEEHFPNMMPIVQALYGTKATIWYTGIINVLAAVIAEISFQQGCVLGSWLYCLSLQKLIDIIIEALDNEGVPFFFVDDGNIVATYAATLRVFQILKDRGPEFGYHIKWTAAKYLMGKCDTREEANRRKEELIEVGFLEHNILVHPDNIDQPTNEALQQYGVTVLGGFIGSDEYIKAQLAAKLEETREDCEALIKLSDLQQRYMLLNWCFKTKVHYWLRTTKLDLTEEFIGGFEMQKRRVLASIMDNANDTGTSTLNDVTWQIAQLPTKHGGLGMENLQHVRYAAIIASAFLTKGELGTEKALENPLKENEKLTVVKDFHRARSVLLEVDPTLSWTKLQDMSKRTAATLQHSLTVTLQKQDLDRLLSREPGPTSLPADHFNWLNSLQSKEAGLWLTVFKTRGFKLTNEEFQVALLHRCF
eukprot:gene21705-24612_t